MNAGSFNTPALLAALSARASEEDDTDYEELDEPDDSESFDDDESIGNILDPLGLFNRPSRRMAPRNYTSGLGGTANGIVQTPQGNLTVQFRDLVRKRDMDVALGRVREDVKRLSGQVSEIDKRHSRSATLTAQKLKALENSQRAQAQALRKAEKRMAKQLEDLRMMSMLPLLRGQPTLKALELQNTTTKATANYDVTKAEFNNQGQDLFFLLATMGGLTRESGMNNIAQQMIFARMFDK
jgi:hypothetical protein